MESAFFCFSEKWAALEAQPEPDTLSLARVRQALNTHGYEVFTLLR